MNSLKNNTWILVWIASLIMIFEVEIRSIGHAELVRATGLFPSFYVCDLGLFLPIFFAFVVGRFQPMFLKNKMMIFLILSFLYGILIFFVRNNPFYMLGQDLRVLLALFTGLSMGAILPNRLKPIAASIILVSASAIFISTVILFALPDADFIYAIKRTTYPTAFILLGIPIVFTAPCMIISILIRNNKLIAISWFSAGVLLIISVVIMQTRSQSLAIALGVITALITTLILYFYFDRNSKKKKRLKMGWKAIVSFLIFVTIILYWRWSNVEDFLLRMESAYFYQQDVGLTPRLEEIPVVFGSMEVIDHLIGMGFNPNLLLVDWVGIPYNTTHIGILNIWWRFGFPFFLAVVYLIIILMIKWLKSLKYLCYRSLWGKINNETLALIVCAPGVVTLFFISCMSGGWAISTMIPLGILWGIYRRIAYNY
jgi:hypothetical protein